MDVLVITPVKDSLDTTRETIEAVSKAEGNFRYCVFNDFSNEETRAFLEESCARYNFTLVHLDDITSTPTPNYKIILQKAYEQAIQEEKSILLVESDVIVNPSTIREIVDITRQLHNPGLVGAITTDINGNFNFPYAHIKPVAGKWQITRHSIIFCCTLITLDFLKSYDFSQLPGKKDWFDIYISKQSRRKGFSNYLVTGVKVLHLPHSSRPWKQLKYSNPLKYYFYKLIHHRDRI